MYNVQVEFISIQISEEVRQRILEFLRTYAFPYVKSITNKAALRELFIEHFKGKHPLKWLQKEIETLAQREKSRLEDVEAIALSETNRLHTKGLGSLLLSRGIKQCTTENSYGTRPMSKACWQNLESPPQVINDITIKGKPKILDIAAVIKNTFPPRYEDLQRTDIPMIPQNLHCYHIMVPIEE